MPAPTAPAPHRRPEEVPPVDGGAPGLGRLRSFDPARLPIATIPRRHLTLAVALLVVTWIVISLGRQVGDASAASERADAMRAANATLRSEVEGLQHELDTVSDPLYAGQQARAHGLGGPGEIAFTLAADAPALGPDAPGSASVALNAAAPRSPLDAWLDVLFGSGG